MEKRIFAAGAEELSLLGFGSMRLPQRSEDPTDIDEALATRMFDYAIENGVNYFDTAYPYHRGESERFVGRTLSRHPRDSYHLASKMPTWLVKSEADLERIFNEQLEKCRVDYFDFYLAHNLNVDYYDILRRTGIYEFMSRKKKEGKIRHLGFSFHDRPELLTRIVEEHEWDFAQIQLNYLDWELQNAARQYEILTDHGLPVVVMEPVRGGTLATLSESACQILRAADPSASPASWAIRFAASLPNVMTVLSGMSNMEQVQDNVATMNAFFPLTEREREVIAEALHAFKLASTIPCTGCRYCMDCPAGVDIPGVFATYNQYCINKNAIAFETGYDVLGAEHQASHCVNCKACLPKCPQHIAIPDRLREIDQTAKKLFSQT